MENIVIDGVDLSALKIKYDALAAEQAAMRQSIRQGSSKFISDNVREALKLFEQLKEAETKDDAKGISQQMYDLLSSVEFVSTVSGVSYTIPYYDRQSDYYPEGTPISSLLDVCDNDPIYGYDYKDQDNPLRKLYSLAESMESDVAEWNTSYC
jgi:hypothetical protein